MTKYHGRDIVVVLFAFGLIVKQSSCQFTPGSHGTTFGGNPVCCAAGLACLRIIEREDLLGRATKLGEHLRAGLRALEHPRIREVRGRGLMVGVEIDGAAKDVRSRLRERNLLTTLGGPSVIRLLPPLILDERQTVEIANRLIACINQFTE